MRSPSMFLCIGRATEIHSLSRAGLKHSAKRLFVKCHKTVDKVKALGKEPALPESIRPLL